VSRAYILHVSRWSPYHVSHWGIADSFDVAALLAKYKGPGMEKPAIRPYTPTSDEGEWSSAGAGHIVQRS